MRNDATTGQCLIRRIAQQLVLVGMIILARPALAASCPGVTEGRISDSGQTVRQLSRQAHAPVRPSRFLRFGRWWIFTLTQPDEADNKAYLFTDGAIGSAARSYLWAGSAQPDETADVAATVRRHMKGIPLPLLTCFLRSATSGEPRG